MEPHNSKYRKPYKAFFAPVTLGSGDEKELQEVALHQFYSTADNLSLLLFDSAESANRARTNLKLKGEAEINVKFRFCSNHKGFHPLQNFSGGSGTCKPKGALVKKTTTAKPPKGTLSLALSR